MGNVQEDSGEYSRRFQLLFKKISENVWKESGECSDHTLGLIWYKIMGEKKQLQSNCSERNIFYLTTYNFSPKL